MSDLCGLALLYSKNGCDPKVKGSSPELVGVSQSLLLNYKYNLQQLAMSIVNRPQLIANFMEAIVYADMKAEGSWRQTPRSSNTKSCVYTTMCARKLFLFDAGLSFAEVVNLAAKKGLIYSSQNNDDYLSLKTAL